MEETLCKVSVLCTAYKHRELVGQALESFVSQRTDFPFEVLVSDDASGDGTAEVIRAYAARYPGLIRPICLEENQYSKGVELYTALLYPAARGEYFAFCEGDDYWTAPSKLQRQADFLDAHPDYSACVHNTLLHYADGSQPDAPLIVGRGEADVPFDTVVQGMSHAFHTSSIMARRACLIDPPEFYFVARQHDFLDYAIGLWLSLQGRIRYLDESMSVYRLVSNPSAWSSGVDRQYGKLKTFVTGERAMLQSLLPHLDARQAALAERVIIEREYELMEIEGRVKEQLRPPYDAIYRTQSGSYKLKHFLKRSLPGLHRLYRKRRGYQDY